MEKDKLILVVEDDPDISSMLEEMLWRMGFSSILLSKGEEVNSIVQDKLVDLVILDILLPGLKGTEICKALKRNATTSQIPVVIMSAYPKAEEIIKETGADDFIAKPFEMKVLFSHLNKLLLKPHLNLN